MKSFLMITSRGLSSGNFEIYVIENNIPKIIIEGEFTDILMPLREFTLRQIARTGAINLPRAGDKVDWSLVNDVSLTIVDGYGKNNITIERATKEEWGGADILAAWLLGCDEDDIAYIVEQSEKMEMFYEDIIGYLTGAGIKPTAESFIAEMQRLLIYRAHMELNDDEMPDEDGKFPLMLVAGCHYLIGSDVKTAFIVPEDYNILRDFPIDTAEKAIDILTQWGSR